MNDTPNYSMPPHMIESWRRLNEFAAKWPKLASGIVAFRVENGITARWGNDLDPDKLRKLAFEHKIYGTWKRRLNRYNKSWFDYEVVIDGITLVLPMAEPIHLEHESCEIKWEEKPSETGLVPIRNLNGK